MITVNSQTTWGPQSIVTNGLVLHLDAANPKSYPGTGTIWSDLSGNRLNGILTNGPTFNPSNGGSIQFDGVNDFIDVGNPSQINFDNGNFTLSVWVRRFSNATNNLRVLSKGATADTLNESGFAIFGSDTQLAFIINPSAPRVVVTTTYSVNQWTNIVCILERGVNFRILNNSILSEQGTAPSGSVSGISSLNIGRASNGTLTWSGQIANVSIYNRALSQEEVTQNFNALRGRFGI